MSLAQHLRPLAFATLAALVADITRADIATDGSLGPAVELRGPDMRIGAELGQTRGDNLFHSFEHFNIPTDQSATFTGPDNIQNVIGRVTGGQRSNIDGQLRSEVGQADVYLINPAGVVMGPNASVDVPAALHVSTADELHFSDGSRFSASDPATSTLTMAAPEAFGFLGPQSGAISLRGTQLHVVREADLTLSAGAIQISDDIDSNRAPGLSAPDGTLGLTAVGAAPAAIRPSSDSLAPTVTGAIDISGDAILDVSGRAGTGRINLRGGPIQIADSTLAADHGGESAASGGIAIQGGPVDLRNSHVQALATATGAGPSISVTADSLSMGANAAGVGQSLLLTTALGAGEAGTLDLDIANSLNIGSGSGLAAASLGVAAGGRVTIKAGGAVVLDGGFVEVSAADSGAAGSIDLKAAGRLDLLNGGTLVAGAFGTTETAGSGGAIIVAAPLIRMIGQDAAGISSGMNVRTRGGGDAGQIRLKAERLEMSDAMLSAFTDGLGNAGQIDITAQAGLRLTNSGIDVSSSSVAGVTDGRLGDAGHISVDAGRLDMHASTLSAISQNRANAGTIEVQVAGDLLVNAGSGSAGFWAANLFPAERFGFDSALTASEGRSGTIHLGAEQIFLLNEASILNGTTAGDAGQVRIDADSLFMAPGSAILTGTVGPGQAGAVQLDLNKTLWLQDAWIDTGTSGLEILDPTRPIAGSAPSGAAGPIDIHARQVMLQSGAAIQSLSFSAGRAGDISLDVGRLELAQGGQIATYSGGTGNSGDLSVSADQAIRIWGVDPRVESPISGKSGLFTSSAFLEGEALGGAGAITITAPYLELAEGGAIESRTGGQPPAGPIRIDADQVLIRGGGKIDASTFGAGNGGSISLNAATLSIDGSGLAQRDPLIRATGLFSQALVGSGDAGDLHVAVSGDLILRNGGRLSTASSSLGDAGAIQVSANHLSIDGGYLTDEITGIDSRTLSASSGFAGSIDIAATDIRLSGIGSITVASLAQVPEQRLGAIPDNGILIDTERLVLDFSLIIGISLGNVPASPITINAGHFSLKNESTLWTISTAADAGPIRVTGGYLWLQDSLMTTSDEGVSGNGGNITLTPKQLILDGGFIQANTAAANARGGDIVIGAEALIASHDQVAIGGNIRQEFIPGSGENVIQAAAPLGIQGDIALATPDLDITASLVPLRTPFQHADAILNDLCQSVATDNSSHLIAFGRGGLPLDASTPSQPTLTSKRLERLLHAPD
ncbi:filamentous hemagglutinin N-terminal domain-containing protein [Rhabdochromatium marinum]|uniref:two-partner secretion domain-containing protein n=1 Tax=Rhabdochromatium marinum TaxID=48729 RepID=UPI001907E9E4|nr:filamentous hemagglutinin N-terminal domain-containing protein [Rhabdochromatium marinum]